jgi:hypothetical protein
MNNRQTSSNKVLPEHREKLALLISMGFNAIEAEEALEANEWDVDASLTYIMSGQGGELESRALPRPSRVSHDTEE